MLLLLQTTLTDSVLAFLVSGEEASDSNRMLPGLRRVGGQEASWPLGTGFALPSS